MCIVAWRLLLIYSLTCPSEKGPQNVHFVPQTRQTYGGGGVKEKILVLLLIEPRSSSPAMLLTGLSHHIRFDIARTMQLNCGCKSSRKEGK
jgi:hypothetical protein